MLQGFRAPLSVFTLALLIALLITPVIHRIATLKGAIDYPKSEERRIHTVPTPRWGGIALYISIIASILILYPFLHPLTHFPAYLIAILICSGFIVVIGAWDDIRPLNAKFQAVFLIFMGLLVQFLSGPDHPLQVKNIESALLTFGGITDGKLAFGDFAWPFTAFYIFVATKTMDTIDGLDGLSAGLACIGALLIVFLGVWLSESKIALISAAVAGSCIGFLRYNFNPAIIFMGTGGAQLLGFILACMSMGVMRSVQGLSVWVPFAIFGIPFFDAFFVIIRRLAAKQPISQADKRHIHHTLMRYGLNQRQTVVFLYFIALLLCILLLNIFIQGGYGSAKI